MSRFRCTVHTNILGWKCTPRAPCSILYVRPALGTASAFNKLLPPSCQHVRIVLFSFPLLLLPSSTRGSFLRPLLLISFPSPHDFTGSGEAAQWRRGKVNKQRRELDVQPSGSQFADRLLASASRKMCFSHTHTHTWLGSFPETDTQSESTKTSARSILVHLFDCVMLTRIQHYAMVFEILMSL